MSRHRVLEAVAGVFLLVTPAARADWYVANSNSNNVSVSLSFSNCGHFNGAVPVGTRPVGVAASRDGSRVYVTNYGAGTVSVINPATVTVAATFTVGGSPLDVAVHPDGSRIYVISNNRVAVVDTGSGATVANIFVVGFANRIAVHPDGTRVYVTTAAGLVVVINTAANAVMTSVPVGTNPVGVAIHPAGTTAYIAASIGLVVAMDLATNTVTGSVPVEGVPEAVAFNPSGSRVYVTNNMNVGGISTPGKLTAIDTATNAILVTQTIDANPFGIAVDRHNIFVTTADGGSQQGFAGHLWLFDTATTGFVHRMDAGSIPAGVATFVAPDPPPLPSDVQVTGIEITQAVQDMSNSVRLVSGRRTFVRVHVKATGAPVPGVTARLFAIRDSCTDAFCISSNIGSIMPNKPESIAAGSSPHRRNLNDSLLFELPTPWTNEDALRFHALLGTNFASAPDTCRTDAPHASAFFDDPTSLKIQFIRLGYFLGGTYYEATKQEQQQSESWIRRTYPLSNLVPTRDYPMPDYGLTSRVDQSAEECQDMDASERSLCAQRYITNRLATLRMYGLDDVVGDADGAYALIPQAANPTPAMPNPFFTRGACCNLQIGAGPAHIADYAAHEIGHLLGRQHPVQGAARCGHTADDAGYPHFSSWIHPGVPFDPERGLNGFDPGDAVSKAQTPMADFYVYDLMGYCKPDWISDYSYNALYISLLALHRDGARSARKSAAATAAVAGDWLAVFGTIPGNPARPAYIQARRLDRVATVPERVPGSYSIRLVGAGGATLADYPFTPKELADSASAGAPSLGFGHAVPFVTGTKTVQIVDLSAGGLVRGTKTVSANPPAVSGVVLQSGPDPVTGEATLSWTASDPDGDPLTYDVLLTRDGGATLRILASGIPLTSTTIDTAPLGGGVAQLRIMASDGVQTGFADSAPFTLVNRPPRVRIVTPGDGTTVGAGQVVNLEGSAFDPQGGAIADANLAWTIPGRTLGQGSRLTVTDLPIGPNPVTLTATNGLGLTGSVIVTVVVTDGSVPVGPTLTAGPLRLGWHVAAGETQLQSADLDVGNAGSGSLEFTAQSSAAWLTLSAAGGNAPETLTLTANPSGLPAGTTASAEVTLTGVGLPGQTIVIPVTLSVGNTFDVGSPDPGTVDHCPDDPDKTEPGLCGCGVADSEAGQACATGQPGVCGPGVTVCAGGSASCVQSVPSSPETCDGLDNDCDGATDEGNPGGGGACSTGLPGICAAGTLACSGGSLACQPTTSPGIEVCGNGIDEDCNGADLACPPVDACTTAAVLDAFGRPDGAVGANWRGAAGGVFYRVAGQRLDVQLGGSLYWNAGFGTSQAAFVTLTTIAPKATAQGVLLKAQDGPGPDASIAVVYDATALTVRVSTRLGRASTPYGSASVAFADGDRLGACATASGDVRVYKNGLRVDTVTLSAADQAFFNPKGGKVGIWSARARKGFLDDFGGGTVVP